MSLMSNISHTHTHTHTQIHMGHAAASAELKKQTNQEVVRREQPDAPKVKEKKSLRRAFGEGEGGGRGGA